MSGTEIESKKNIAVGIIVLTFVVGKIIFFANKKLQDQKLFDEYIDRVVPFVNISLEQMSIKDKNNMTIEKYTEMHTQSCILANQLLGLATDGRKFHQFSSEECIEYMYKTRPQAINLPSSASRKTASQQ